MLEHGNNSSFNVYHPGSIFRMRADGFDATVLVSEGHGEPLQVGRINLWWIKTWSKFGIEWIARKWIYRFIQTSDWCLGQLDGHFARRAECHQSFTADIEDGLVVGRGLYVGLGTSFEGMGVGLSNFVLELGIDSWNRQIKTEWATVFKVLPKHKVN